MAAKGKLTEADVQELVARFGDTDDRSVQVVLHMAGELVRLRGKLAELKALLAEQDKLEAKREELRRPLSNPRVVREVGPEEWHEK